MGIEYRAAVLHAPQTQLSVETVIAEQPKRNDVLVRIKAAAMFGRKHATDRGRLHRA